MTISSVINIASRASQLTRPVGNSVTVKLGDSSLVSKSAIQSALPTSHTTALTSPCVDRDYRPRSVDLYEVFCAVLYLLRTSCQWQAHSLS